MKNISEEKLLEIKENLDYYLEHGKYKQELKELYASEIEVRGRWNNNKHAISFLYDDLALNISKSELLIKINEKIKLFLEEKNTKVKKLYYSNDKIKEEDEVEISKRLCKDYFYKFTVIKSTKQFYILERKELAFAATDSKNDYVNNFYEFYKTTFKIIKKDISLSIGDTIIVYTESCDYYGTFSMNEFNKIYSKLLLLNEISSCSVTDKINITNHFTKVLTEKFLAEFDSINKNRIEEIEELTKQYEAIPLPTHRELLESSREVRFYHDYNNNSNNFEVLNRLLRLDEREVIGKKLRELNLLHKNSAEILENAKSMKKILKSITLTERQIAAAKAILNLYYNQETNLIEYGFIFHDSRSSDFYERGDKEDIKKLNILKTKCELSCFDF